MKCVCIATCQLRMPEGHIQFFNAGDVDAFDECPPHFQELETRPMDFKTAYEEEMLEAKWTYKDADAFMKVAYGVGLKKGSKADLVSQILDIRYRNEVKQS